MEKNQKVFQTHLLHTIESTLSWFICSSFYFAASSNCGVICLMKNRNKIFV